MCCICASGLWLQITHLDTRARQDPTELEVPTFNYWDVDQQVTQVQDYP